VLVLFFLFFFYFYVVFMACFFYLFFMGGFMVDYFLFGFYGFDFSFCVIFDYVSFGFFICVSLISSLVFLYRNFYMEGTVDMRRFLFLVFLFVVSMFFLVFSGNFFVTMVGWDGLGLVSFCLVIFYGNSSSLESGLVTVFRNRVGDVFFLVCFFFFSFSGWWGCDSVAVYLVYVFLVFLFFGAITKSAQVPFSAWLPAAMAAPTPVSSLVHSSTLVTAGIYVLIRYHYLFDFLWVDFFKIFSIFTMVLAGMYASFEADLKKVVAMSTLSQLGMMLFVVSVGCWVLSFIHIIIHAFFKSMLFLGTGSLIGQVAGMQDSRFYGGNPVSYFSFVYFFSSCLCLSGFPFLVGFYSKDFIINSVSFGGGFWVYCAFLLGCVFTVVYRARLLWFGYVSFFKTFCFLSFFESSAFFVSVSFIFLKC
jgi:NADH-ubiquinone oxidoreductase chain 5